jgi:hypothetical protein
VIDSASNYSKAAPAADDIHSEETAGSGEENQRGGREFLVKLPSFMIF